MSNVFLKNLAVLAQKNPKLAQDLQAYVPSEVPKLIQENGVYNLQYKDKLLHNPISPLGEANEVFARSNNTPVSIHLIYGLGLGYLFQIASINSQGDVILYEPDLNILWFAFTLVDFTKDLSKSNVYITSKIEEVLEIIYKKSGSKNSPVLLTLPSQRNLNPKGFDELVKKLQDIIGSFTLDRKYIKYKVYPALKMLLQNIPSLLKEEPLARSKNCYEGKTAVVVSAGPTLDRDIEILKAYRDRYILFTVGTAVKTLYANGIKPDFICIIETYNSVRQLEGLDLKDVNFITEPFSNPELRKFDFKKIYSHISANSPINQLWAEISGENIEEYWSKGTVSYTALNCARLLGCTKIVLVGQDLAYVEGQCYSKDSAYKDLMCKYNAEKEKWEIVPKSFEDFAKAISALDDPLQRNKVAENRLRNLNASLYYVRGIQGGMLPTESVYATFVKPLQEYVAHFNDRSYINASLVGAQLDGFNNLPLEEALKDTEPVGNINLTSDFQFSSSEIEVNLKNKLLELKKVLNYVEDGKKIAKALNNEIKRYRVVSQEVLKILKKLSLNYLEISGNLAGSSKLLDLIIASDKIDLDYDMKMMKDLTVENIMNLNAKLNLFYDNTQKRIVEIERLINESFNTAC